MPSCPGCGERPSLLFAVGLYLGALCLARRLPAGRNRAHHVCACAGRLDGTDGLYASWRSASAVAIIFRHPLADVAAKTAAPIGAAFCFLALVTGSLWGKPMWGAWWVWDARLTSMFVLFLLYLGYMAVWQAIDDPHRAAAIARIVALAGFVNVPIVKFSVDWWNSLHQPASVFRIGGPTHRSCHAGAACS